MLWRFWGEYFCLSDNYAFFLYIIIFSYFCIVKYIYKMRYMIHNMSPERGVYTCCGAVCYSSIYNQNMVYEI